MPKLYYATIFVLRKHAVESVKKKRAILYYCQQVLAKCFRKLRVNSVVQMKLNIKYTGVVRANEENMLVDSFEKLKENAKRCRMRRENAEMAASFAFEQKMFKALADICKSRSIQGSMKSRS